MIDFPFIPRIPSISIPSVGDNIAIFDSNFTQIFTEAKILKLSIKEDAKVMEHPLENGETITDHAIVQPVEIEIDLIVNSADYKNTYSIIKKSFTEFTLLTVQTKTGVYSNQVISSMPHQETSDMFNAILINLKLKEALFVEPQYGDVPISPKDKKNQSTTDRGNQNGEGVTPAKESEWHKQNRLAGK